MLYTDYGHHAPALAAVYQALRTAYPDKKIVAWFQPHQARRVLEGRDNFVAILRQFDEVKIHTLYTAQRKLSALLEEFPEYNADDVSNFTELGEKFAHAAGGIYTQDITATYNERASSADIWVILSAGDLDREVRKMYQKNKNLKRRKGLRFPTTTLTGHSVCLLFPKYLHCHPQLN